MKAYNVELDGGRTVRVRLEELKTGEIQLVISSGSTTRTPKAIVIVGRYAIREFQKMIADLPL